MLITKNQKMRLTSTRVDKFVVEGKARIVWDNRLPSFGVRVSPTGLKAYFLQYRIGKNGRQRGKTIGRHPIITADRAREVARDWLLQAWDKVDPNAEIKCADDTNPTVEEFGERYLEEHSRIRKKKTSIVMDEDFMKRFIVPRIGMLHIADVIRSDIARIHSSMSKTPHQANLVRALLSHLFTMAEAWGLRPDGTNPVKHVKKFPTKVRVRFLSDDEMVRLASELKVCDKRNPVAADYFRLVMLTGGRRNEILTLRWTDIDFEEKFISLRDSKTGPRKVSDVDLCLDEFAHFRGVHVDTARRWFQEGREVPARKVGDRWLVRLGDAILNKEGYIFEPDDFVYFNRAHLQKRPSRKRGPNIAENKAAKKTREEAKRLD